MDKELITLKMYKQQEVSGLIITPVSDTMDENPETTDGIYDDNYGDSYKSGVFIANKKDYKVCVIAGNQKLKIARDRLEGFIAGHGSINAGFIPLVREGDFNE